MSNEPRWRPRSCHGSFPVIGCCGHHLLKLQETVMHRAISCAALLVLSVVGTSWGRIHLCGTALIAARARRAGAQEQAAPATPKPLPGIAQKTDGFKKLAGYFNLYWDE